MNLKRLTFLLSTAIFLQTIAHATESVNQREDTIANQYKLDEVIIRGNRLQIPFSQQNRDVVIINSKEIQSLPVNSVNELLKYVAGLDVRQRGPFGGQADIAINGGTFDQTLILLNGLKVIDPQTGHNMFNLPISTDIIKRIEILKGAAASAYGINALNGVINIVTIQPEKSSIEVSLDAGSSFERDTSNKKLYGALGLNVHASLSTSKTNHLLAVSTLQSSGHRYNTALNNNKVYYQNEIKLKNQNHLQFSGGYVFNDFGANGFYAPPGDKESKERIQTVTAGAQGVFHAKKSWTILPSISFRNGHDDYIFVRQNPAIYENKHATNMLDVSWNNNIHFSSGVLGVGLEYIYENINSNSLGIHKRSNFGLNAEYSYTQISNLSIHAGAYLNYSKSFNWQLLPSLDIGYQVHPHWRLYANVGTGMRVPTYTDWYYKGPQNIGNSALKPEKSIHAETGVKFTEEQIRFSASYFYRVTNDFIDWTKDSLSHPWQPHNFQKIKLHGISSSIDYAVLRPKSEKGVRLDIGLSYTWLHARMLQTGEKTYAFSHYALENLKNQFITQVNIGFLKHYKITLAGRYEQRVNAQDYFILDSKIAGAFGNFEVNLDMTNLTDRTYLEIGTLPLPGRWLSLGVKWKMSR